MQGPAYYNEIDPGAAQWLRNLIAAGHIAPGDVDERSITDVRADDLRGYRQCHFFAGIGGWSYALRLAGVPHDRSVWTGSCPCQPFSAAGKQRGSEDERHLWPAFFDLIRECRPPSVFGEQVAGAAGLAWLDHVCADLEGAGYAAAAADLPACSVGAPHRRQRLYWVAHAEHSERGAFDVDRQDGRDRQDCGRSQAHGESGTCSEVRAMAHDDAPGRSEQWQRGLLDGQRQAQRHDADGRGADGMDNAERPILEGHRADQASSGWLGTAGSVAEAGALGGGMADANQVGHDRRGPRGAGRHQLADGCCDVSRRNPYAAACECPWNPWRHQQWIACSDGKARPTQRGIFPLADGLPAGLVRGSDRRLAPDSTAEGRVMRLRGYGNAIVPQLAAAFVRAAL